MALNKKLLQQVVDWTAEQERLEPSQRVWEQGVWYRESECGTTYCVAGWLAVNDHSVEISDGGEYVIQNASGRVEHIDEYAGRRLGLTSEEDRNSVFDSYNTATDVEGKIIRILNDAQAESNGNA